jgi:PhnB protein
MSHPWKPAGYNSVSPYLVVNGAQRVIDFLKATFAATDLRRYENADGSILHAEVRIEDSVIMMGDAGGRMEPVLGYTHIYVPDVDATYARALAAGATSIQEPRQQDHDPDRRGGFKDPAGNTWWIASQVQPPSD